MDKRMIFVMLVLGVVAIISGVAHPTEPDCAKKPAANKPAVNKPAKKPISREDCMVKVATALGRVNLDDDLEVDLNEAFKKFQPIGFQHLEHELPSGCGKLRDNLKEIGAKHACFSDKTIMGHFPGEDLKQLMETYPGAEQIVKAEFLCSGFKTSAAVFRNEGSLFEVINSQPDEGDDEGNDEE